MAILAYELADIEAQHRQAGNLWLVLTITFAAVAADSGEPVRRAQWGKWRAARDV